MFLKDVYFSQNVHDFIIQNSIETSLNVSMIDYIIIIAECRDLYLSDFLLRGCFFFFFLVDNKTI